MLLATLVPPTESLGTQSDVKGPNGRARIDTLHRYLMKAACELLGLPPKAHKAYSMHSYRITLATRLRKAGARDASPLNDTGTSVRLI